MRLAVVELRPAFEAAVKARIEWLAENAPAESWLDNFVAALHTLRRDIALLPEAAPPLKEDAWIVVRLQRFPFGLPYVVYYAHLCTSPVKTAYLTQLFHERQRRQRVDVHDRPW